jgi:putative Holliday junction resolvase
MILMPLPATGRLAGIDYGEKRIGVAVCDGDRNIASPLETYHRKTEAADWAYFAQLAKDYQLVGFIVGLPVHASGEESGKSWECRNFGAWLSQATGLPVAFFDERYTSAQADSLMAGVGFTRRQRKDRRDMLAAQVILAAFLESPRAAEEPPAALEG